MPTLQWDYPAPHIIKRQVAKSDIDALGHCNNVTSLRWLEQCAWDHSNTLGITLATYKSLDRAMVVHRHELDYLKPTYLEQQLSIATWITHCDKKLTLKRHYQIIAHNSGATVLRANTYWVCVSLSNGRPKRLPVAFVEAYGNAVVT